VTKLSLRVAPALLCAALASCRQDPAESPGGSAGVSVAEARVAEAKVVDLAGLDAELAKHRGRGVLLNFWALWCAPCVAELPELLDVGREFASQGGDVVLVSYDLMVPDVKREEALADVAKFLKARGVGVPVVVYDAPDFEAINERYHLPGGVPVTVAIDRDGRVVETHDGRANAEDFRELMRRALAP
jgi:thiol-disulfide isomerase/thioredoxin